MVESNLNINQILRRAKEEGEIFLVSLSSRELEKTGFGAIWQPEKEFFNSFSYVNIYLIYTGKEFALKYIFDGDPGDSCYDYESEIGKDSIIEAIEKYLEVSE